MDVAWRGRAIPGTIGLLFGGLWGALGASALPAPWRVSGVVLAGLVTVVLALGLWRKPGELGAAPGMFRRTPYLVAVGLEVAAIAVAAPLLRRYGLSSFFNQAVGVIVGLHFLGLWRATRLSRFLWIVAGMCGVSLAAMALPETWRSLGVRDAVTGAGNALVLWIGAGRAPSLGRLTPARL